MSSHSQQEMDQTVKAVVTYASKLLGADLAVLVLFGKNNDFQLGTSKILVSENQAPSSESWWLEELESIAAKLINQHRMALASQVLLFEGRNDISQLKCVSLNTEEQTIGLFAAIFSKSKKFTKDETAILPNLGNLLTYALQNADSIQRLRRIHVARERERIACDMHDGLIQALFGIFLNLEVCLKMLPEHPELVREKLLDLQNLTSKSLTEVRQYIYDLYPTALREYGLARTIEDCVNEFTDVNGTKAEFSLSGAPKALPAKVERALYYITQEALGNVLKHARAKNVSTGLIFEDNKTILRIEDDGEGFEESEISAEGSLALASMKDRARSAEGDFAIASRVGDGTKIEVVFPASRHKNPKQKGY